MSVCIRSKGVLRKVGMCVWVRYRKSVEDGMKACPLKRIHSGVTVEKD